ncbi:RNA-directed DNA polymerase, eukaryota, reverse transcriptase zinc-binding domain protein [Tanacetum coccineum]
MDVKQTGMRFTWNQRPNAETGILKKLDRVLANEVFVSTFPNCFAEFKPYRISDHRPAVLKLPLKNKPKPKPFKFSNYIVHKENFSQVVKEGWSTVVGGHKMFRVVKKLRLLKKPLRKLMWSNGNLHDRVVNLRSELDAPQTSLDSNPHSIEIREDESHLLKAFNDALLDEERFLQQKSKIEWLCVGVHGGIVEGRHVASVFMQHCENSFGCSSLVESNSDPNSRFSNKINPEKANFMIRSVTDLEVKEAMFSIGENKSPGLQMATPRLSLSVHGIFSTPNVKGKRLSICFADDLFMFSYANFDSVKVISDALQEFKNCSGLVLSLPKSTAFFANVGIEFKNQILEMLHFEVGELPVKYLGVPLISSGLFHKDCKILVQKVKNKIDNWKNKSSSFAGRIQLVASRFPLCQGDMKRGKAKVKWDVVCLPKSEGGLGYEGKSSQVYVAQAWQAIRPRAREVEWFDVVWFSQCIPRHAFIVWLLIGEKLKTQDKIRAWEVADPVSLEDMKCPLCNLIRDSHSHLFFECGISRQKVKVLFHIPDIGNSRRSVVNTIAHKKLARLVVAKVLFGATIYYIWQERNNKLFKKKARQVDQIFELIFSTTRLKLMALNMKNSVDVVEMMFTRLDGLTNDITFGFRRRHEGVKTFNRIDGSPSDTSSASGNASGFRAKIPSTFPLVPSFGYLFTISNATSGICTNMEK